MSTYLHVSGTFLGHSVGKIVSNGLVKETSELLILSNLTSRSSLQHCISYEDQISDWLSISLDGVYSLLGVVLQKHLLNESLAILMVI